MICIVKEEYLIKKYIKFENIKLEDVIQENIVIEIDHSKKYPY